MSAVISPPMGKAPAVKRRHDLKVALGDTLSETRAAARDTPARQLLRGSPPWAYHAVDIDVGPDRVQQEAGLPADGRELRREKDVVHQRHVGHVVLATHPQPGAMPRERRRVVVSPELPEPTPNPGDHHLE